MLTEDMGCEVQNTNESTYHIIVAPFGACDYK